MDSIATIRNLIYALAENAILMGIIYLAVIVVLVRKFLTRNFDYWKERGVYFIQPEFLYGNMKENILLRESFYDAQLKIYAKLKGNSVAGVFEGNTPTLMVLDPELIKRILVYDFDHFVDRVPSNLKYASHTSKLVLLLHGSHWKGVRSTLRPAFSSAKSAEALAPANRAASALISHLENLISHNGGKSTGPVRVSEMVGRYSLRGMMDFAMGEADLEESLLGAVVGVNEGPAWQAFLLLAIFYQLLPASLSAVVPLSFISETNLRTVVRYIVSALRRRHPSDHRKTDLLQVLMANFSKSPVEGEKMPGSVDESMVGAQMATVLLAAFENVGSALTAVLYCLAGDAEIQARLRSQILRPASPVTSESLTRQSLKQMTYLDMVFAESMRMYPILARLDRVCTRDYTFPDGLKIEKGTRINVPVYGLHNDPAYYPDPLRFDPMRFTKEEKAKRPTYVYLPFGTGPRNCLGLHFAELISKVFVVRLLRHYTVHMTPQCDNPLNFSKRSLAFRPGGVCLEFKKSNID